MAGAYDRVVGNPLYNKLVWNCPVSAYADAARGAIAAAGDGPMLDAGCGSLVFTAPVYRGVPAHRLILLDRSLAMLRRGQARAPAHGFIQGDILDLPFLDGAFAGTMSWGMLHLFGSASRMLDELARVTRRGGVVAVSGLVCDGRWLSDRMLETLRRRGEIAAIESGDTVSAAFAQRFDGVRGTQHGAMLFLTGTARG